MVVMSAMRPYSRRAEGRRVHPCAPALVRRNAVVADDTGTRQGWPHEREPRGEVVRSLAHASLMNRFGSAVPTKNAGRCGLVQVAPSIPCRTALVGHLRLSS